MVSQKGILPTVFLLGLVSSVVPGARAQFLPQAKLFGSGSVPSAGLTPGVYQGASVAVSSDGNTAIVGGPQDNSAIGAAWVFTRTNLSWTQQGGKLAGTGTVAGSTSLQGSAVSLSADGNTAIVGGPSDNFDAGAAWIFTRAAGAWTQQGGKLVGAGAANSGGDFPGVRQGSAVALSGDGMTAIIGGPSDNLSIGAAWVFTLSNGVWTQQGNKLVASDAVGGSQVGISVALSSDGNTAILGGPIDNGGVGAAWIFTRGNGVWTQQGSKLVGLGAAGSPLQGKSVALSADGNTAAVGGPGDNSSLGAVWIFTRNTSGQGAPWNQSGFKLTASDESGSAALGSSVSLSANGITALAGGPFDNRPAGAVWVFTNNNGTWSQRGSKLTPFAVLGTFASLGTSVAISGDATTAVAGAPADGTDTDFTAYGSALVWTQLAGPRFGLSAPTTAIPGVPFNFTVTALDANGNPNPAYSGTVRFISTDLAAILPANSTLTNGAGTFSATFNTLGPQNITAIDTVTGASGYSNAVAVAFGTMPVSASPAAGSGLNQTFTFTFTDPRTWEDLTVVNVLINNFLDGRNACYLAYSRQTDTIYLVNDAGAGNLPGLPLNGSGNGTTSVSNSQCGLNLVGSSAFTNGNTLSLVLNLNFFAGFAGDKVVYMAARDLQGDNSGWQALGTWGVPGAVTFPAVGGVSPARGAGSSQVFTFTFSDTKGYQDLGIVNILVNNFLDGRQACYLAYSRPLNQLFLVNDTGTGLVPGLALNGSGSVSNSQCTVNASGSSAVGNGNTLTLILNVSFTGTFDGNRVIYLAARDSTDANNSGWQASGSWTVQ
ncbi:MAG TPA: hypothetical protein VE959_36030 [Bryobacteraceae bacterium]|nr:hypothetical protein [Bryobacteraceae bacterium]